MEQKSGDEEISLVKLGYYNLLFFVPIGLAYFLAQFIGTKINRFLQVSPSTAAEILMIFFIFIIFLVIVPVIRKRETIKGIRYTLVAVFIVGLGIALPSVVIKKDFTVLLSECIYIATYLMLTFIYCPEVLGIVKDIRRWFKEHKQLLILLIYVSISVLYIFGFAIIYYDIHSDSYNQYKGFSIEGPVSKLTFVYFSAVTFTTLGYGDINPLSPAARFVAATQALLGMVINVVFIAILLMFISGVGAGHEAEKEIKKVEKDIKETEQEVQAVKKIVSAPNTEKETKKDQYISEAEKQLDQIWDEIKQH
jgi:hypothetical protein